MGINAYDTDRETKKSTKVMSAVQGKEPRILLELLDFRCSGVRRHRRTFPISYESTRGSREHSSLSLPFLLSRHPGLQPVNVTGLESFIFFKGIGGKNEH